MKRVQDRYHIAYFILFLQGIGGLLPWNVFITAANYFADRLQRTSVHESFLNWFSLAFNMTTLFLVSMNAMVLRKYLPRPRHKIGIALFGISIALLLTTILVECPTVVGMKFFNITMGTIVFTSACTAYLQEGLYEITSMFPQMYTQALMTGQSAAGLIVSISAYVLALLHHKSSQLYTWSTPELESTAFLYFLCSFTTVVIALLSFGCFLGLPFVQQVLQSNTTTTATWEEDSTSNESLLDKPDPPRPSSSLKILWAVRHHAITVFFTFLVTLALFPVVTSSIQSISMDQTLFVSLTFVVFNFGDLLGRACTSFYILTHRRLLVGGAILRLSFFPLFFMCNVTNSPFVLFRQDFVAILFLLLLSWSNGYFCSVAMMQSVHIVAKQDRELCGAIMFYCLCIGLSAGSLASFGLRAILCQCNPF